MNQILRKSKFTLKGLWFWLSILITTPFLVLTNTYLPFGSLPFHEQFQGFNTPIWSRMESLIYRRPEDILWMCLVLLIVFLLVPKKFWKWIFFVYLGLCLLIIGFSYL